MENFSEVFNIVQGDVVSFTGGGGKTSLIFCLAEELSKKGRVLITTTTKMYIPAEESYDQIILREKIQEEMDYKKIKNIDFLGNFLDFKNGKVIGVDDEVLKEFIGRYDYILIEADGSAGKSLKYWNDSDPVISKYTDKIIGVTNLDALGKTIEEGVHRYENFCEKLGVQKEQKIDYELMVKYINSSGFFKTSMPQFANHNREIQSIKKIEKYIFINGIEGLEKFNSALNICREISLENIILGSIREREIYPYKKISAIALLSGFSKRMGEDKLFLDFTNRPLVSYLMENLIKINFHKKILVSTDERIDKLSRTEYELLSRMEHRQSGIERFTRIINRKPENGQSFSIKLGIEFAKKDAYMFFMGDQPLLTVETVLKLMKEFMKSGEITLPTVGEEEFSPVIFPNRCRDRLCEIKGDRGGKSIIQPNDLIKKIKFQDAIEFMDIDTPEEMEELKNRRG